MKRLAFGSAILGVAALVASPTQAGHHGYGNDYYCNDGYDSSDVAVAFGVSAAIIAGAVAVDAMTRADDPAPATVYVAPAPAPTYAEVEAAYETGYGHGHDDGRAYERERPLGISDSVSSGVLPTRPRASDPRRD